jgi:hypothetical protein
MRDQVGGFEQTAEFFEIRAHKARDPEVRERLVQGAVFYRRLAAILPAFPPKYKSPRLTPNANRWRSRAEQCRAIAACLNNPEHRGRVMELAESCDGMVQN